MATLGRKAAVAVIGRLRLSGLAAWLCWLFVHIFFLIGFRNRFVVMFEWAWSYFTYQRSARLILHEAVDEESAARSARHKPAAMKPATDDAPSRVLQFVDSVSHADPPHRAPPQPLARSAAPASP